MQGPDFCILPGNSASRAPVRVSHNWAVAVSKRRKQTFSVGTEREDHRIHRLGVNLNVGNSFWVSVSQTWRIVSASLAATHFPLELNLSVEQRGTMLQNGSGFRLMPPSPDSCIFAGGDQPVSVRLNLMLRTAFVWPSSSNNRLPVLASYTTGPRAVHLAT
jgi:hypothetical protein